VILSRFPLAGAFLVLAATALAQSVDAPIERYREAAGFRELGAVRGRAFQERRRPSSPDLPLAGTAVALYPRSEAWLFRLQAIKRGVRDSLATYREAADNVRRSREAYEKSLLEAGAGDLPHMVTADSEGIFTLDGIPAGPWILFASRSTYVNKSPRVPGPPRGQGAPNPFLTPDRLAGYHVVTDWLRELTVVAGRVELIELTDRNAWLRGISENREPPPLPDQPHPLPR
jgi:hypothetical protein